MRNTLKAFQPSVAFHIETSHLFCKAKQMTGFYMKRCTGLKWDKQESSIYALFIKYDLHRKHFCLYFRTRVNA